MVELKDKTVEELRKMASKKKIEGRSKMNKAELVRALKKKTSTKKTMKRRKMRGGALTEENMQALSTRNYNTNPLYFYDPLHYRANPVPVLEGWIESANFSHLYTGDNNFVLTLNKLIYPQIPSLKNKIYINRNNIAELSLYNFITSNGIDYLVKNVHNADVLPIPNIANIPGPIAQVDPSNRVNINAPNPPGISTHNDGECAICMEETGTPGNVSNARKANIVKIRPCGHVFHRECLQQMINHANEHHLQLVCPKCRRTFRA